MKTRRCKSFSELDIDLIEGGPPSKIKTGPVALKRADNEIAENLTRGRFKPSVTTVMEDDDFIYSRTPNRKPRKSITESDIFEKERERERYKKRKETMLLEELKGNRKEGFEMPGSLEHAPSLSIPVNLEQVNVPVE